MRSIIWFHRDLRLHDHPGIAQALANHDEIMAVVIPPQSAGNAKLTHWQAIAFELQQNLKSLDIPLTFVSNQSQLPIVAKEFRAEILLTHERMNVRERRELEEVQVKLPCPLKILGELTLFSSAHARSLQLAELKPFTRFKKFAEAHWKVPKEVATGVTDHNRGLARLKDYLWDSKAVLHYHQTRNGLLEFNDSSKLSPWLAWGVLSPRRVYFELQKLKTQTSHPQGIDALVYELIWRDYFKFLSFVQGESFFTREGLRRSHLEYSSNAETFEAWKNGKTGESFVDAHMRELLQTGWMSNRGRQNVASYLAKTLGLDWLDGAHWFEHQLLDEDPENNFGNWQYLAGVGTDPRDRVFNVHRQAEMYDPTAAYQRKWLSEVL